MEAITEKRFWDKVEKTSNCWNWTASVDTNGYGQFISAGRNCRAHRVAFELLKESIPTEKQLDHLCRNKRCVNPDHLEIVTGRVNVLRGTGVTARNAQKTHCPKGHPYSERNTYHYPNPKKRNRGCHECRRLHTLSLRQFIRKTKDLKSYV